MSVSLIQFDRIVCDVPRCPEAYEGTPVGCCYSAETRAQAKALGWRVNIKSGRRLPGDQRVAREDWCPAHAVSMAKASGAKP